MNPKLPDYSAVYNGPNLEYCTPCQQPPTGANMGLTTMPGFSMENPGNAKNNANQPAPQNVMPQIKFQKGATPQSSASTSSMMQNYMPPSSMPPMSSGSMPQTMQQGTAPQSSMSQGSMSQGPMVQGSVAQGLMAQRLISPAVTSAPSTDLTASPSAASLAPITDTSQVMPLTMESMEYLNGFLRSQIGRRVRVDFLIGTNTFMDRSGLLLGVGANYILLREASSDDIMACDFYNIKFVTFFY
jgi:hypothetical protein